MRYLLIFLVLFTNNAYAQFNYREAARKTPAKIVYNRDFDFAALNSGVSLSSLEGEEIYFAKRSNVLNGSRPDSVAPILGMTTNQEANIRSLLGRETQHMLNDPFYGTGWKLRGSSIVCDCNSATYTPRNNYYTYTYKPRATVWTSARAINIETPYDAVENQFFKIVECHDSGRNQYGNFWICFALQDTESNTIKWVINSRNIADYHAHFKGYLIKTKEHYVGKKFYVKHDLNIPQYIANELNGEECKMDFGKEFVCTELTFVKPLMGGVAVPFLIFRDTAGVELAVSPDPDATGSSVRYFEPEQDYMTFLARNKRIHDSIVAVNDEREAQAEKTQQAEKSRLGKKYGKATARMILRKEVALGQPMSICKESWGEPFSRRKSTHRDIITETWIYGTSRWLRFTDGYLTAYSE